MKLSDNEEALTEERNQACRQGRKMLAYIQWLKNNKPRSMARLGVDGSLDGKQLKESGLSDEPNGDVVFTKIKNEHTKY